MIDMTSRLLSQLGLARRAGELLIGQDRVFSALGANGGGFLVLVSADCSGAVLRKLVAKRSAIAIRLDGVTRELLGGALGIRSVQVVAISTKNGFAEKLKQFSEQGGSRIDEQNQGI